MSVDMINLSRKQGREFAQANWSQKDVNDFLKRMQFPANEAAEVRAAFKDHKQQEH